MNFKLTASMMCADYRNLEQEVRMLDEGGIDSFHIDIMDGRFVGNFAMSLNDMSCIAGLTKKPLDVHLMVEHPVNTVDIFLKKLRPGDTVYIHPEAEYHPSVTVMKIQDAGMIPGIAINPGTSVESIVELLHIVKKVLIMSVNPGNASQMFLPFVERKITKLLAIKEDSEIELWWDGACTSEKILKYAPRGIDGFVLGTSLLFGHERPYGELIKDVRNMRF
ncbi:ribulose-phosphate 3-epimerase [Lachnospiraceae bacterium]|nr:ribulose-phosphate 3-epimerase [Lachnospiraceae bacterium]